jgi:hypothetical protein
MADLERGKVTGEFAPSTDSELLIDAIVGPIYFRKLLRSAPSTDRSIEDLIDQVLRGVRP